MKPLLLLALSALAFGQSFTIDAGGPTDRNFTGGYIYSDPYLSTLTTTNGVYKDLRAGASFSYDLSAPFGSCAVQLRLIENRPPGSNPATQSAVGTRIFTVTANGVSSGPIDVFALAGAQNPTVFSMPAIPVSDGFLHLKFTATKGNATVSAIDVSCTPTAPSGGAQGPPGPAGPQGPPGRDGKDAAGLPISVDANGDIHVHGTLIVDGDLESGAASNKPTELTVRQSDGSMLKVTFVDGAIRITR